MQTARPLITHPSPRKPSRILVMRRGAECKRSDTKYPPNMKMHSQTHSLAGGDGDSGLVTTDRAKRLDYLRKELALMRLQAREIQECGNQMLETTDGAPNIQRDLLHLRTRIESVLWQLNDVIQVTQRLTSRLNVREGDNHNGLPWRTLSIVEDAFPSAETG